MGSIKQMYTNAIKDNFPYVLNGLMTPRESDMKARKEVCKYLISRRKHVLNHLWWFEWALEEFSHE